MQFTLFFIYLLLYNITMFTLMLISLQFNHISIKLNLITYILYTLKYKNNFFIIVLLLLSGLPPMGFFLVKLNIIMYLFYNTQVYVLFLLSILFLVNMVFYLQFFQFKNLKIQLNQVLNIIFFKSTKLVWIHNMYNTWFFFVLVFFFVFFLWFFYIDLWVILTSMI